MADNNTFAQDLTAAREAFSTLRRTKGVRPAAVKAFLDATDHEGRMAAVEEHTAGMTRRGFKEAARFFENHGDQTTADVFWALRDDIDLEGDVFQVEVAVKTAA